MFAAVKIDFFFSSSVEMLFAGFKVFLLSLKSYNVLGIVQHEIRLVVEIESGCSKIKDGDLSNIGQSEPPKERLYIISL